jgi:hypothetical protein
MIIKFKKILSFFFGFLFLFKLSFAEGFLQEKFIDMFSGISTILEKKEALIGLVFLILFFGIHSLFLGFLRFIFSKNVNASHNQKEIKVISFMLSFISASGLFFIFKTNPELFLIFFGGFFSLIFVIIISLIIATYIFKYANKFKNNQENSSDENNKSRNIFYWFFVILGLLIPTFFLVGYSSIVLSQVSDVGSNCVYKTAENKFEVKDFKDTSCRPFFLFSKIYEVGSNILDWLVSIFLLLGIFVLFGLFSFKKKDSAVEDKDVNTAKSLIIDINNLIKKINKDFKDKTNVMKIDNYSKAINYNSSILSKLNSLRNNIDSLKKIEDLDRKKLKDSFNFDPRIFALTSNSFLEKLDRFVSFNLESENIIDKLISGLEEENSLFSSKSFSQFGTIFNNNLNLWNQIRNNLGYLEEEVNNISLNSSLFNLENSFKSSIDLINKSSMDEMFKSLLSKFIINKNEGLISNNGNFNLFINFNIHAISDLISLLSILKKPSQNQKHRILFINNLLSYLENIYNNQNFSREKIKKLITESYKNDLFRSNLNNEIDKSVIDNKDFIEIYNLNYLDLKIKNSGNSPPPGGGNSPHGGGNSSSSNSPSSNSSSTNSKKHKFVKFSLCLDINGEFTSVRPFYIIINNIQKYSGNSYWVTYSRDELGLIDGVGKLKIIFIYNNKVYKEEIEINEDVVDYPVSFNFI